MMKWIRKVTSPIPGVWLVPTLVAWLLGCDGRITTADPIDGGGDSDTTTETSTSSDADTDSDSDSDTDNGDCFDELGITGADLIVYFGDNDSAYGGDYIQMYGYLEHGGWDKAIKIELLASGAPTTAGTYPIDDPNPYTCDICIQVFVETYGSTPSPLFYVPVAGSGDFVIDVMPSSIGPGAVGQAFSGHFTADLQEIDSQTYQIVDGGCYLSDAYFEWDIVITDPPGY